MIKIYLFIFSSSLVLFNLPSFSSEDILEKKYKEKEQKLEEMFQTSLINIENIKNINLDKIKNKILLNIENKRKIKSEIISIKKKQTELFEQKWGYAFDVPNYSKINFHYNRYPNETAIICSTLLREGTIKTEGRRESISLVIVASFELIDTKSAIYTVVTGPLLKDSRFDAKYPGKENIIGRINLTYEVLPDSFVFMENGNVLFTVHREEGRVFDHSKSRIFFKFNECRGFNRFDVELKMDRYKSLFKQQEQIVQKGRKDLKNMIMLEKDKKNLEIYKLDQVIKDLENYIEFAEQDYNHAFDSLKESYDKQKELLKNEKSREEFEIWYNSPEQILKREKKRKRYSTDQKKIHNNLQVIDQYFKAMCFLNGIKAKDCPL